jgi:hypothetical protein
LSLSSETVNRWILNNRKNYCWLLIYVQLTKLKLAIQHVGSLAYDTQDRVYYCILNKIKKIEGFISNTVMIYILVNNTITSDILY